MDDMVSFDGEDMDQERDGERLNRQMNIIRERMENAGWLSVQQLSNELGFPATSVSAQIRNLRKDKFGGRYVERRYQGNGLYQFKLHPVEGNIHV
jgi:DNA-binding Lrp family transcriptional regulator